jgi:hypothetical protein
LIFGNHSIKDFRKRRGFFQWVSGLKLASRDRLKDRGVDESYVEVGSSVRCGVEKERGGGVENDSKWCLDNN